MVKVESPSQLLVSSAIVISVEIYLLGCCAVFINTCIYFSVVKVESPSQLLVSGAIVISVGIYLLGCCAVFINTRCTMADACMMA